jgi:hypothetical protein
MEVVWLSVGWVLVAAGIVGCVVPVVPGPILSYCGLLCLLGTSHSPTVAALLAFGVVTAVATVLDYVVPALGAKKFNCSKLGIFGCAVGTLVGIAFFPLGLLLGPFLGAVIGELIAGKSVGKSVWGGIGAFIGFLAGTFLKLVACSVMAIFYAMSALSLQSKFPI